MVALDSTATSFSDATTPAGATAAGAAAGDEDALTSVILNNSEQMKASASIGCCSVAHKTR
jgi:hypothetical protein